MDKTKKYLKIGQLVKITDVSASTIKYYAKEGLLPEPIRPNKTMAYYDEACINKVLQIKKLQKDKFLPLEIIKRMLDVEGSYDDELASIEEVLLLNRESVRSEPIKGSQIERHTGYPLEKIQLLEESGLVNPDIINNIKQYDKSDCRIIELAKRRDSLGIPFDHTLEVLRCYHDAIAKAVAIDQQIFIERSKGLDISKKNQFKTVMESDKTVDEFLILCRQKQQKLSTREKAYELNNLSSELPIINIFPTEGAELPDSEPDHLLERCFYFMCSGDYQKVKETIHNQQSEPFGTTLIVAEILADLLSGDINQALKQLETHCAKPSADLIKNVIAALTFLFQIDKSSGFTDPLLYASRMGAYLRRIEVLEETCFFTRIFSGYICGTLYLILPNVINHRDRGFDILLHLKKDLAKRDYGSMTLPSWITRTLDFEILPALKIRINRYLADGYLKTNQAAKASNCLDEMIKIDDQNGEHAAWARIKRLAIN